MTLQALGYDFLAIYYRSHLSNIRIGLQSIEINDDDPGGVIQFYKDIIANMELQVPISKSSGTPAIPSMTVATVSDIPVFCPECGKHLMEFSVLNPMYSPGPTLSYHCDRCMGQVSFNYATMASRNYVANQS